MTLLALLLLAFEVFVLRTFFALVACAFAVGGLVGALPERWRLGKGFAALQICHLLVPWQALVYGSFDFSRNQDLVIWMGAPLAYLAARSRRDGLPSAREILALCAIALWVPAAVFLHHDPHGLGPRNLLLLLLIGWVPVSLAGVLFARTVRWLLARCRRQGSLVSS